MFSMKRVLHSLFGILILGVFFLQSCSKSPQLSVTESLASYVENEEAVVAFGSVDLMSILDKADYAKTPKFGPILENVISQYASSINLKSGLFFALMPSSDEGITQMDVVCFLEISNPDSIAAQALRQSYDLEESGDMRYFRDHDFSLCLKGNLAAVLVKNGEFDEKIVLADIMDKASQGASNNDIIERSKLKGEIHLSTIMERSIQLGKGNQQLDAAKLEAIKELQKDTYQEITLYTEDGQVRLTMGGKYNPSLAKRLPFNKDENASIRKKIGSGEPTFAISMNMDTRKFQALMDDFSLMSVNDMVSSFGGPAQLMMVVAGGKISNVVDGQIGAAFYANGNEALGVTPDLNVYAEFGPNGFDIANMAMSGMGEDVKMKLSKESLFYSTSGKYDPNGAGIIVPKGCESFGKHGFSFFANFEKMDMQSFELEQGAKLLYLVKYVNGYFDADKGEIIIKLKQDNPNALKQVSAFMIEEFASQISQMSVSL